MKDTAKQVSINPATRMLVTECEDLTKRIHGFKVENIELTQKAFELLKAALVDELKAKEPISRKHPSKPIPPNMFESPLGFKGEYCLECDYQSNAGCTASECVKLEDKPKKPKVGGN
jgi:hypothetical protein